MVCTVHICKWFVSCNMISELVNVCFWIGNYPSDLWPVPQTVSENCLLPTVLFLTLILELNCENKKQQQYFDLLTYDLPWPHSLIRSYTSLDAYQYYYHVILQGFSNYLDNNIIFAYLLAMWPLTFDLMDQNHIQ